MKAITTANQEEILDLLKRFLKYNSSGLLPFMQRGAKLPEYLGELYLAGNNTGGERVQHSKGIPFAQMAVEASDKAHQIINRNGGISLWQSVFDNFKSKRATDWQILATLSQLGSLEYPNMQAVADKCYIGLDGVKKAKKRALRMLAFEIELKAQFSAVTAKSPKVRSTKKRNRKCYN